MFEGEAIGTPDDGVATGEVVFNTALVRLPGDRHRPVATRGRSSRSRTRTSATTASTRDDDESRRPFCRGVVVRDLARRPSNWRGDASLDDFLRRHGVARHRRHRHPTAHPPHPRRGRDARRVRHRRARRAARGRDAPTPAPTASTSSPTVTTDASRTRSGPDGAVPRRRLRLRHQAHDPPPARPARLPRRGGARVHAPRPTCWPASPTACSCRTAPATRPRSPTRSTTSRGAARRGAGVRHLPRPPAPRPRARRADVQAAVRPPRRQPPGAAPSATGRVEITSQNHNFAVDADSLAGDVELTHVNLNDGVVEGMRLRDAPRVSRAVPPRGRPRPARRRATCSTSSPRSWPRAR